MPYVKIRTVFTYSVSNKNSELCSRQPSVAIITKTIDHLSATVSMCVHCLLEVRPDQVIDVLFCGGDQG